MRPVIQHASLPPASTDNECDQLNAEDFKGGENEHHCDERRIETIEKMRLDIGDFAAVKYDNEVLAGKVLETTNGEYYIRFIEKDIFLEYHLRWPKGKDKVWVRLEDIVSKIKSPTPQGRSGRCF